MPVRFSPHRQGAGHSLDPEDLVLLPGTPAYTEQGEFDTRILVKNNGRATRALWCFSNGDDDEQRVAEFHQWGYQLDSQNCEHITTLLDIVAEQFTGNDLSIDGGDTGDFLTFWRAGSRFTAELHTGPPEMVRRYTEEQHQAFSDVVQCLYSIVPQRSVVGLDPQR